MTKHVTRLLFKISWLESWTENISYFVIFIQRKKNLYLNEYIIYHSPLYRIVRI